MSPASVLMIVALAAAGAGAAEPPESDGRGQEKHIAPEACGECHRSQYDGYLQTSHARAMRQVEPGLLDEQFSPDHEYFYVKKDTAGSAFFRLATTDAGYEQQIFIPGETGAEEVARLPLELEMGSGKFARAYLRWEGERLFLNPLSYYTGPERWAFGPGIFGHLESMQGERPVTAACLDCHSGYFEAGDRSNYDGPPRPLDEYLHPADTFVIEKANFVLPISCVKCHGPAERHVRYHRENPGDRTARHVARIGELARTRQVEVCGFCHTPPGAVVRPPFSFGPGDAYSDFIEPAAVDFRETDPHATQAPYLTASQCFERTPTMTCTTCHDPHRNQRGDLAMFSRRCMECHEPSSGRHCTRSPMPEAAAEANCIDCHMPRQTSSALRVVGQRGESLPLQMRNHWIKVHELEGSTDR